MLAALVLAQRAKELNEVPVGALLVCRDTTIGQGFNRRETSARTAAHAEMEALEDYSRSTGQWRLPPGTSVFVTVEPCLMCTGALLWSRADNIYYGCEDPKNAGIRSVHPLIAEGRFDHRFKQVTGGILGESCALLLSEYFKKKR